MSFSPVGTGLLPYDSGGTLPSIFSFLRESPSASISRNFTELHRFLHPEPIISSVPCGTFTATVAAHALPRLATSKSLVRASVPSLAIGFV